jgi:DNA primase
MARYKDEAKEQVRDAVDFTDLVGSQIDLTRSGVNQLKGLCPFHDERTPSFGINPVEKVYYCFGCSEGGDVYDFVMKTQGLSFVEAMEYLADRYGVTLEVQDEDPLAAQRRQRDERLYELLERTTQFYERYLWESDEAAKAREYLASRGLSEEVLRTFRVGYAPSVWDKVLVATRRAGFTVDELYDAGLVIKAEKERGRVYDRFRRRVIFPLADRRGRVIGFGARRMSEDQQPKYLNSPEGGVFHKAQILYGAHLARKDAAAKGSIIVTEGYTDVIALHQAGVRNVVCIMGTSLTEEQVKELVRMAPRCVLALDADDAGQAAMLRAAKVAGDRKLELRVASLPPGQDPAELVQTQGPEAVQRLVDDSVPFVRFRVNRVLANTDGEDAEDKDRAIGEIRPILSAMAPSALREDLVRVVADRLELSLQLAALLTQPPGGGAAPAANGAGSGAAARAPERAAPAVAPANGLDRRARMERTFLTLCIALPGPGQELLDKLDPEEHLRTPVLRRAAVHLRAHLRTPTEDVPEDDAELVSALREMTVRAGQAQSTPAALQVEWLQLDLERINRAIGLARQDGSGSVGSLARERITVLEELSGAMEKAVGR